MKQLEIEIKDAMIEFEELVMPKDEPRLWMIIHTDYCCEMLLTKDDAKKILRVLDEWVSTGKVR